MKLLSFFCLTFLLPIYTYSQSGNVGIGVVNPQARLHVDSSVIFTGSLNTTNPGLPPLSGAGTRMMWYPDKSAFRVGTVTGSQWDSNNIGRYSIATGSSTTASGLYSTAMGEGTNAIGLYSTAMGDRTSASGINSTAMGYRTSASGINSTAMGYFTTAFGKYSTTLGRSTLATGYASTVLGMYNDTIVSTQSYQDLSPTTPLFIIGNGDLDDLSNAFMVRKDGNIGIGTNYPSSRLHLSGEDNNGLTASLQITSGAQNMLLDGNEIDVIDDNLNLQNNTSNNLILVNGGGKVGIGTTAPEFPLHIQNPGIVDQQTISMVIESATSKRPILLFSEVISNHTLSSGMSIEYDGSGSGAGNKLRINKTDGNAAMAIDNDGNVGIGTTSPIGALDVKGNIYYTGNIIDLSDRRAKNNIHPIDNALSGLIELNPVTYFLKEQDSRELEYGLIAQEVKKVFPNAVSKVDMEEGYFGVSYIELVPILVKGIQEQQQLINELSIENKNRRDEILQLRKEFEALKEAFLKSNQK